jgi:hypothetical protein
MATAIARETAEKLAEKLRSELAFTDLFRRGAVGLFKDVSSPVVLTVKAGLPNFNTVGGVWHVLTKVAGTYYLIIGIGETAYQPNKIRLFTSTDGLNFTEHANSPILTTVAGTWESSLLEPHSLLYVPEDSATPWWLYYCGYDGSYWRVGLAKSANLLTWTRYGGNPIVDLSSQGLQAPDPLVVRFKGKWIMFVSNAFWVLTSTNGVDWTPYKLLSTIGNPQPSPSSFYSDGQILYALTHGVPYLGATIYTQFGLAYSLDGLSWVHDPRSPIYLKQDDEASTLTWPYLVPAERLWVYYGARGADNVYRLYRGFLGGKGTVVPLWRSSSIGTAGASSINFYTLGFEKKTFYIISNQSGTLYIQAYDEVAEDYKNIDSTPVSANVLTPYMTDYGARLMRLRFVPSAQATVSAWAVLED